MNTFLLVLKDLFLGIIYLPVWWYTRGLFKYAQGLYESIQSFNTQLGFTIWLQNIFVPMYGQTDIGGRLFSFFMRIVNIIIRGIFLMVIILIHLGFLVLWIIGPYYLLQLI